MRSVRSMLSGAPITRLQGLRGTSVRRRARVAVAVAALALAVAGCGSDNARQAEDSREGEQPTMSAPVTIEHAYGTTTIKEIPKRVVTVGWHGGDAVLALGVVPVGIEADINGSDKDGLHPWFRRELERVGGEVPDAKLRFEDWSAGYDYERILALDPDIIIAARISWLEEAEYKRLNEIAPTVGPLDLDRTPDWDVELRTVAQVLGAEARADTLIAAAEQQITEAADRHPKLDGKSVLWGFSPEDGNVRFLSEGYGGLNLLGLFGMSEASGFGDVADKEDNVSLERLGELTPDLAIVFDYGMTGMEVPLFSRWAPIAAGRYLLYNDMVLDAAVSTPSVLSLPWIIEESGFLGDVERGLDGGAVVREDPETTREAREG